MDGYLVLLSRSMDDLPVRLCATYDEAKACADQLTWDVTRELFDALKRDASTPCVISIVRFMDGKPRSNQVVRNFLDESERYAPVA
jgi:hypothetical protein